MVEPLATVKGLLLAGFIAAVLAMAAFTPLLLHYRIPDAIPPVAAYFCPETGLMAPRYRMGKTWHRDPGQWFACLDDDGRRIERLDRHYQLIWTLNGIGFLILFPPLALGLRRMFWSTEAHLRHRAARQWRRLQGRHPIR